MAKEPKAAKAPTAKDLLPKLWDLAKTIPYAKNARTHPPAQIELLAELMKRWGPDQSIVVDEDRVILKGHGRRDAAYKAGIDRAYPVVQRFGLSEAEKEAMRIADNQVGLLSGWDNQLVQLAIGNLKLAGYPIDLLGFGDAQLVQFETTPGPPGEFPAFGADIQTEHQCPHCGYKWSGSSAPPEPVPDKPKAKAAKTKKK